MAAARAFGLDFVPVAREPFDLVMRPGEPAVAPLLALHGGRRLPRAGRGDGRLRHGGDGSPDPLTPSVERIRKYSRGRQRALRSPVMSFRLLTPLLLVVIALGAVWAPPAGAAEPGRAKVASQRAVLGQQNRVRIRLACKARRACRGRLVLRSLERRHRACRPRALPGAVAASRARVRARVAAVSRGACGTAGNDGYESSPARSAADANADARAPRVDRRRRRGHAARTRRRGRPHRRARTGSWPTRRGCTTA